MRPHRLALPTLAASLLSVPLHAATYLAILPNDFADAVPGDGICSYLPNPSQGQPVCTLRAAIMEANASPATKDTIQLINGLTYTLTRTGRDEALGITGDLNIRAPVRITSLDPEGPKAVIDGNQIDRVFYIQYAQPSALSTDLVGLAITGGDVTVGVNRAGGGIFIFDTAVTLLDVSLHGNRASEQGGGVFANFASLAVLASEFRNNHLFAVSPEGIGLDVQNTDLVLAYSSLHDNASFTNALAPALDIVGGSASINNSTISRNGGRGIMASATDLAIRNTTVVDNGDDGISALLPAQYDLIITNTVMSGNGHDCGLTSFGTFAWNVVADGSCQGQYPGNNNLYGTAPRLSALGHHGGPTQTHRPLPDSPLVDRTLNMLLCDAYDTDQRALPRNVAYRPGPVRCDTGSVELEQDVIWFDPFESH